MRNCLSEKSHQGLRFQTTYIKGFDRYWNKGWEIERLAIKQFVQAFPEVLLQMLLQNVMAWSTSEIILYPLICSPGFSSLTAQTLYSGVLLMGSRAALVSLLAAFSV
jgi:hypothetical protein